MYEESDTDTEWNTLDPLEHDYASGGLSEFEEVVDTWGKFDPPPTLSPPNTMDISSVRRPPTSLMTSADWVSTRGQHFYHSRWLIGIRITVLLWTYCTIIISPAMSRGTASPRFASPRLTNFDSLALFCTRVHRRGIAWRRINIGLFT